MESSSFNPFRTLHYNVNETKTKEKDPSILSFGLKNDPITPLFQQQTLPIEGEIKFKEKEEKQLKIVQHFFQAKKLLDSCWEKNEFDREELLNAAEKLLTNNLSGIHDFPPIFGLAHELYDKAAEKCLEKGDMSQALKIRSEAAKIPLNSNHPMYDLNSAIQTQSQKQPDPAMGAYFSYLGNGALKGGCMHVCYNNIKGEMRLCFDFRVNLFARKELTKTLDFIRDKSDTFNTFLPSHICEKVHLNTQEFIFRSKNEKGELTDEENLGVPSGINTTIIKFVGIGKIIIGTEPNTFLYQAFIVEMLPETHPGEGIKNLQMMLTMLGLGPQLGEQSKESEQRMKIAQLYRAFCPKESYQMEVTKEYFQKSIFLLRKEIETKNPQMQVVFKKYLDDQPELMVKEEIYPGKIVWTLGDLSDELKKKGMVGLAMGLSSNFDAAAKTVCSIIRIGALSSYDRYLTKNSSFAEGESFKSDIKMGSINEVFLRCVTEKLLPFSITNFANFSKTKIVVNLKPMNRVPYFFTDDHYGNKFMSSFQNRSNPFEFVEELEKAKRNDLNKFSNEVMIKNRIAPEMIESIVVSSMEDKNKFIQKFRDEGLVEKKDNKEHVLGKPIDQFVYFSGYFKKEMWSK